MCPCKPNHPSIDDSRNNHLLLSSSISYNGTTENFRDIFIGRCYNYIEVVQANNQQFDASKYNCVEIFNEFKRINVGRNPCDIKIEDYNKFISLTEEYIPPNSTLFWSGTYTQVRDCK